MMKRGALVVSLLVVAFAGCERQETPVRDGGEDQRTDIQSETNAVKHPIAVRIDGRDLTRKDIVRNGKVLLILNMNKMRVTAIKQKEWGYLNNYCKNAVRHEIQTAAVANYVKERKLTADTNLVATVVKAFERRYGIRSKKLKRWHRLDDFRYILGKNASRIDAEIKERVDYELMMRNLLQERKIEVSESDVEERLRQISAYNQRAAATNALVYAEATNVWQQAVAATNRFEELASKYSQDEYISQGCEWGMFTRDQLRDETALQAYLPKMKVGDLTPPIESDGGLAIVRLDPSDDSGNVTLSRIFFKLPMYCEDEKAEEAKAEILRQRQSRFIRETLDQEIGKLKIEYPDGTNVCVAPISPKEYNECDK